MDPGPSFARSKLPAAISNMIPSEREEALARREATAERLHAKLERDRAALEADISASAAASKAANTISRALEADAAQRLKQLEAECAQWEGKLARLKAEGTAAGLAQP